MNVSLFLAKHPEVGMLSSFASFLLGFMEKSMPYLQYTGILLGLVIGVLTVYIKFKEAKKASKN